MPLKFWLQGVRIPTLGALDVVPWQVKVGDMEVTTRRPIFCLARNLVQRHNLMDDQKFWPGRTMGILRWTQMEGVVLGRGWTPWGVERCEKKPKKCEYTLKVHEEIPETTRRHKKKYKIPKITRRTFLKKQEEIPKKSVRIPQNL